MKTNTLYVQIYADIIPSGYDTLIRKYLNPLMSGGN